MSGAPEIRRRLDLLKQKWLVVVGVSVAGFAASTAAAEDGSPPTAADCVQQSVTFDGIKPLHYATVDGDKGAVLPLYHKYPAACAATDQGDCAESQPLKFGEPVAVGKTCGA